jgi:hypothetical protein
MQRVALVASAALTWLVAASSASDEPAVLRFHVRQGELL